MNEALRRSAAHIFVDDLSEPSPGDDDLHHLSRVLRLRDGQVVSVSDGRGAWRLCQWHDGKLVSTSAIVTEAKPTPALAVALVPVKGDRTDDAIEKLVEIGIDTVVVLEPVEHSVVRWDADKAANAIARYRRIARAASSQSRRVHLPEITGPRPLNDVLTAPGTALAEPGGATEVADITMVVVGPEGGFSPAEVGMAARTLDLGPGILRADTAAVVAATQMVAHWRR